MSLFSVEFFRQSLKTLPLLAIAFGPLLLFFGVYQYWNQSKYVKSATEVSLIVEDMIKSPSSNGIAYAPKFRVVDGKFKGKVYQGNFYSSPPIHQIGDSVLGLINVNSGVIKSYQLIAQIEEFAKIFMTGGLVFLVLGLSYLIYSRYKGYDIR